MAQDTMEHSKPEKYMDKESNKKFQEADMWDNGLTTKNMVQVSGMILFCNPSDKENGAMERGRSGTHLLYQV